MVLFDEVDSTFLDKQKSLDEKAQNLMLGLTATLPMRSDNPEYCTLARLDFSQYKSTIPDKAKHTIPMEIDSITQFFLEAFLSDTAALVYCS